MFKTTSKLSPLQKLSSEYQKSQKPYIFRYKDRAESVSQRKFQLLIHNIREIIEGQLKRRYLSLEEENTHYWTYFSEYLTRRGRELITEKEDGELGRNVSLYCGNEWEMDFVESERDVGIGEKVNRWIVLVIANYRLAEVMELIGAKMGFLFEDGNYSWSEEYITSQRLLSFLEDKEYRVESSLVQRYEKYLRESGDSVQGGNSLSNNPEERPTSSLNADETGRSQAISTIKTECSEFVQYRQRRQTAFDVAPSELMKPQLSFNEVKKTKYHRKPSEHLEKRILLNIEHHDDVPYDECPPLIDQNRSTCSECGLELGKSFFGTGNLNLCTYSGKWFCNQCISPQKILIPYKIIESLDMKEYPVSRRAYSKIKRHWNKPLLEMNLRNQNIRDSRLISFLIQQKQLHLIYDITCQREYLEDCLRHNLHYLLKPNKLSISNIFNIVYNKQEEKIRKICDELVNHFKSCLKCQSKGFRCRVCGDKELIFTFDIKRVKGCSKCKSLYHNICLQRSCQCQDI